MEGTSRAATTRPPLHQIVYRWQRQDLFGRKGLGPAATSLPVADLARLAPDLAEAVAAEFGGDGVPLTSTALIHVDSFAAVVHRVASEFEQGRLGNHAHVLLGPRAVLTPHAVLALDGWTWRGGQPPLGEIPVGRRLARVPPSILDDALAERAFVLRDAAREQADALAAVLAAVLRRPAMGFSVKLADCGGDPVALFWGLFDLITVPLPGPLTFSTYETTDGTTRPRFVVVPRWPSSQMWSGRHRIDPDAEARTDVFREAADLMVARYVEDDWDTMYPLLRGLQELRRHPPYDRAVEIRARFTPGAAIGIPAPVPADVPSAPETAFAAESEASSEAETGPFPGDAASAPEPMTSATAPTAEPDSAPGTERAPEPAAEPETEAAPVRETEPGTSAQSESETATETEAESEAASEPESDPDSDPAALGLDEPEAFPVREPAAPLPDRPDGPPPSAGTAERERWKRRGVYDEDIDALEFAANQLADGGADRAVAFVDDVVALAAALELADVRLLPFVVEHLPRRFDDAPNWTPRERQAVRYVLLYPARYGDRLAEAEVPPEAVSRFFERLVRVVLTLEKDPSKPLRTLARDLVSERRRLAPYPSLDEVLRRSPWEPEYCQELGRRWAELNPPGA